MNAYSELYIEDAAYILGEFFDHMVVDLKYDIDEAFLLFARSGVGRSFGKGNPKFVSGMSGVELARYLIFRITGQWTQTDVTPKIDKSPEYWTGWALAQYQWERNVSFDYLIEMGITAGKVRGMYKYHEADISKLTDRLDLLLEQNRNLEESRLKRLRKYAMITQRTLSERSGVSLRMIQLYEQGQNDLSKASYNVVKALADTLGCETETLIG